MYSIYMYPVHTLYTRHIMCLVSTVSSEQSPTIRAVTFDGNPANTAGAHPPQP